MNRTRLISVLLLGALVAAAAFGAVAYRSASAATPTPSALTNDGSPPFGKGPEGDFRGGFAGSYTNQDLANALGISLDELNTAYQKANDAALKQAVEQGLITQAQADQLSANGSAFPFGERWGGWMSQNGIDFDALLADALGITSDKLQVAYSQAYNTRIDQAVTDGNLTQEQADLMKGQYALHADKNFQSSMQSAYEAAVQQAVKGGVITQAQADQILKNESGMGFQDFGGPRGLGGFEGGHGFGRNGRWGGDTPMNPAGPVAPTATP